jgi:[acyl-carrier-protein] S-malonyltransferase
VTTLAFIFPGQGSQYVGMGQALAATWPRAAEVYEEADRALGEPLSELTWSGDPSQLDLTINAQPALLATSIAYLRALESALEGRAPMPRPAFYAGHSMGQYSAMVAAGILSLADGLRLVRERGRQMQASAEDGAMAAVIGLPDDQLEQLRASGSQAGPFAIANRNAPGQVVISGSRAAVEAASEAAPSLGARRVIPLPVSVAAHSSLMATAAERMREILSGVEFRDPSAPLLANADARPLETAQACRAELIEHLTKGVDWVAAVEAMSAAGVTTFVEVGPGKVLSGLVKRIAPEATAIPLDEPDAPGRLAVPDLSPTTAAPA